MGAGASSRAAQLSITDPKVCRSFLVGTCPHDLFTNTKQDLGPCPKVHSEPLKTEYESTKDTAKYGFEYDYMRDLQKYIDECNRRIEAAQRRLEKTPDEIRQTNALVSSSPRVQTNASPVTIHTNTHLSPVKTNLRPLQIHRNRTPRNRSPRRSLGGITRIRRILPYQTSHANKR
jgi:hypothetical protein